MKIPFRFGLKDEFRPKGNSPGEYLLQRRGKLIMVDAKKSECNFSGFIWVIFLLFFIVSAMVVNFIIFTETQ